MNSIELDCHRIWQTQQMGQVVAEHDSVWSKYGRASKYLASGDSAECLEDQEGHCCNGPSESERMRAFVELQQLLECSELADWNESEMQNFMSAAV